MCLSSDIIYSKCRSVFKISNSTKIFRSFNVYKTHVSGFRCIYLASVFLLFRVVEPNCPLLEVLEAVRPHLQLTFENILAHINTIYVLKTRQGAMGRHERYLRIKVSALLVGRRESK